MQRTRETLVAPGPHAGQQTRTRLRDGGPEDADLATAAPDDPDAETLDPKAEEREHRRCMRLVRRHLPTSTGPVEIGCYRDLRGKVWRFYQWPDGTVVGPAGPFAE